MSDESEYPAPPLEEVAASARFNLTEYTVTHCGRDFAELTLSHQIAVLEQFQYVLQGLLRRANRELRVAITRKMKRR